MGDSGVKIYRMFMIGNFYLVDDGGGLTLIDTGARDSVKKIARKFARLGYNLNDLKRIVITHSHIDHAGSLAALKRAVGAVVFAHETEAPYMEHRKIVPRPKGPAGYIFQMGEPFFRPEPCEVDVTLADGDVVEGTGLRAIFTPGHTPGHVCLYHTEAKVLFTGDILVNHFNFLAGPRPFFSSDIDQARLSVKKLIDLDLERIYFSHGTTRKKPSPDYIGKLYRSFKIKNNR